MENALNVVTERYAVLGRVPNQPPRRIERYYGPVFHDHRLAFEFFAFIRPSDGGGRDAVLLVAERWYDFREIGGYLENVGQGTSIIYVPSLIPR